MEKEEKKTPRELYEGVAEYYAREFRHKYYEDIIDESDIDSYWIGDEKGTTLYVNDNYYDYETIRYAVDNNVPEKTLFEWYDYCCSLWVVDRDIKTPTLNEWCNGYKKKSENDIELLNKLKANVLKAEQELKEAIYEFQYKK